MNVQIGSRYPRVVNVVSHTGFQVGVILLTFILMMYYNIAYFLYVPFTGVWLYYADGSLTSTKITRLDLGGPGEAAGLKTGDQIVSIDGRAITNLYTPIHSPKKVGETERYVVERNGQMLETSLVVGSYLRNSQYWVNMLPTQLLSLLIYFFGLGIFLFSAADDVRARLVAMIWLLAGVILAATGPGYISCAWWSSEVAIIAFAVSNFFSLAAHLYFPITTFSAHTRNRLLWAFFGLSFAMLVAYILQEGGLWVSGAIPETSLSADVIKYAFVLIWLVNIGLLIKNRFIIKDKEARRQTNIILLGTLIGCLPFLLLSALPSLLLGPQFAIVPGKVSVLSLIFIPITYGYVIYQRKLLKIDLFINRALVLFVWILLILFTSATILAILSILLHLPAQVAVIGGVLCVLVTLPSASLQKKIQVEVDRALYGGYYDFATVTARLSDRLAQIRTQSEFVNILTIDLPQQMQIEKSLFLMVQDQCIELDNAEGQPFKVVIGEDEICQVLVHARFPVRASSLWPLVSPSTTDVWASLAWGQVFVPIFHGAVLYGILVLGNRSTGGVYSNSDIQIISTASQQAALSLANITMIETLRGLYQRLVETDEAQRRDVARELHDDILYNLFMVNVQLSKRIPDLAAEIEKTMAKLRQTIKAQRSSFLDHGIELALKDLIGGLNEITDNGVFIKLHIRLPEQLKLNDNTTTALYRITQESLANVLKHADADQIVVTLEQDGDMLILEIKDNGIGMADENQAQPGHYGLIGMVERATTIGATLKVLSAPDEGTAVMVKLKLAGDNENVGIENTQVYA